MPSLLLLIPTKSYRTRDFIAAGERLGIDVVVGSDQEQVLAESGEGVLEVDFADTARGVALVRRYAERHPIDYVVGVDSASNLLAAEAAAALGLKHNAPETVAASRNKYLFRTRLAAAGVPVPEFRLVPLGEDPAALARELDFPCVIKPLHMAMSRGVIRADGHNSFVEAFYRVARIVRESEAPGEELAKDNVLVEAYVPGTEYAVEGLVRQGRLEVLAIFDKPDPLEGPYFEETIYVTPARIDEARHHAITAGAQAAIAALGLEDGPTHIDLRVNHQGVWVLEADARSIGGRCGRSLRFLGDQRLEDIILRHAAGLPIASLEREAGAAGVMMIPIPRSGVLAETLGLEAAQAVAGVEEVSITIPAGQPVVMLPEGDRYLGFIIARGDEPEAVVASLRAAHAALEFVIEERRETPSGDDRRVMLAASTSGG